MTARAPTKIHHINFLVKDLPLAVSQYLGLGLGPFEYDELPERGALTARARIGESWLVLVQPTDTDSVPGKHLTRHGEGFFLLSLAVDDLDATIDDLTNNDIHFTSDTPRAGLADWRVIDIEPRHTGQVQLQLAENATDD